MGLRKRLRALAEDLDALGDMAEKRASEVLPVLRLNRVSCDWRAVDYEHDVQRSTDFKQIASRLRSLLQDT